MQGNEIKLNKNMIRYIFLQLLNSIAQYLLKLEELEIMTFKNNFLKNKMVNILLNSFFT
jgi:hypothetical protein